MKIQGTRGGITIRLNKGDKLESVRSQLEAHKKVLKGFVILEIENEVPWEVIQLVADAVSEAEGKLNTITTPGATKRKGETKIIAKMVRSGGKVVSDGSVVILSDVHAGAEIVAEDDIIVIGILRGVAHAGASGNEKAVIWAKQILSPQLRIASFLLQNERTFKEKESKKSVNVRKGFFSKKLRGIQKPQKSDSAKAFMANPKYAEVAHLAKEQIVIRPWQ